ncbi:TPA: SpaH/EbpB family LPXTG-anchored major pilin [Streptococcus pyogenes]|uniref:SpaH/EbpB family LPXTG-anchored major pilin n=1 Tax=Streptococcus pyogenes TaxID=1314 RepID=UPI00109C341A|nr:SpaH/EbpB family LPXTG-anchored major pilin [Streptococcus pyogenes]VGT98417.1 cell wall surface anchor family protein [Streptococcus pyogenes]VHD67995.1 cell wall surface anchor family protein [Streptococcus pyogenes]VHF98111.1 cell wall surface anchor family protein [Streptococcus pyogenes]HEP1954121.1 SpaH/EbpB family LPXTG-anchored major pilin [Streptococcus pyogenes]HER6172645.1 SpaH/EbpB family LPXTG-anchored major pilin [Streptococcus pyogenes]
MKLSKKLLYSAMAFTMLTSATVAPVAQIVTGEIVVKAEDSRQITTEQPKETTVNIFKLQGADFSKIPTEGLTNANGSAMALDTLKANLSNTVEFLPGVKFKYYKVLKYETPDTDLKNIKTIEEADKRTDLLDVTGAKETELTDNGGKTTIKLSSTDKVKYLFVESSNVTTVNKVVGYTAVPFILHLPVSNSEGKGYYNEVNVYPKNTTVNEPKIDKDVTKLGNDDDSYQIGQNIKWYLKSTVPENIDKLDKFVFTDTLSKGLSFTGDNIQTVTNVLLGTSVLTPETDYKVLVEGNKLTVSLTPTGIQTVKGLIVDKKLIADANQLYTASDNIDTAAFLSVEVNAKLNADAVMGSRIENNVELDYGHESDVYKSKVPTNEVPEVHTGGARFEKVDATVQTDKLQDAEFGLYSDIKATETVKWTEELLKANEAAIQAGKFKETNPIAGTPIIFKSASDGSFEIKGLRYGDDSTNTRPDSTVGTAEKTGKTTYYIKELVAPKGYVVSQDIVQFDVTYSSYYQDPTKVALGTKAGDAAPTSVKNNKRPEIPNTGGIGTAIFVVVGVIIMFVAARGMRRQKEDN